MSAKEKEDVKEMIQFIMKMLKLYPKDRPTAAELLQDKFFSPSSRVAPTPNGSLRGLRNGNSHIMAFEANGALLLGFFSLPSLPAPVQVVLQPSQTCCTHPRDAAGKKSGPPPPPPKYCPEAMMDRRPAAQPRAVSRQDLARRGNNQGYGPPGARRGPPAGPGGAGAAVGSKRKIPLHMQRMIDSKKKMKPAGR